MTLPFDGVTCPSISNLFDPVWSQIRIQMLLLLSPPKVVIGPLARVMWYAFPTSRESVSVREVSCGCQSGIICVCVLITQCSVHNAYSLYFHSPLTVVKYRVSVSVCVTESTIWLCM